MEQRDIDIIFKSPIDWEYFRNKSVLITGATGRLGRFLVEAFSQANSDWNLNIIIILQARSREKLKNVFGPSLQLPNIKTLVQDINQPLQWPEQVNFIFHLAGAASPRDITFAPVETLWGHVQGTRHVLELARKNRSKVLYVSTIEIYGDWCKQRKIKEMDMGVLDCANPRACYPEAKRLCETMLEAYREEYDVPYVGVRLSHTLGPGIDVEDGRSFAEFLKDVRDGENIVLHSDGIAVRTYTYTPDAIGAMLLAFTKGCDQWYNIANLDNAISIGELAKMIASLDFQKKVKVEYASDSISAMRYLNFNLGIMDDSLIRTLGWKPYVGIEDTFRYTLEAVLQQN